MHAAITAANVALAAERVFAFQHHLHSDRSVVANALGLQVRGQKLHPLLEFK